MMKKVPVVIVVTMISLPVFSGWQDFLKQQVDSVTSGAQNSSSDGALTSMSGSMLSQTDVAAGLKQALEKGVGYAVDNLGKADGFLGNDKVRIPMPENLRKVEQVLRQLGQDKYADEFVVTMNRAAEEAVPLTADILKKGVRELTIEDAKNILNGPDDAATSYLRKVGGEQLRKRISPIVESATARTGVTNQYKNLFNNLGFMGGFMNPEDYDIDRYVTDETMDGLFQMLAEQEKQIRENPLERTTDLLKKVFAR
ncbi:MAG: DUF4197 domain-containing protein [Gammaproteobacteria bacterium]|nr:DUF4197 domain-containing protein [Gammaproteobacteria bacterium]NNJ91420.1 DUF4197 domain-containing protein [Gammaproteobacteria bacterium]